ARSRVSHRDGAQPDGGGAGRNANPNGAQALEDRPSGRLFSFCNYIYRCLRLAVVPRHRHADDATIKGGMRARNQWRRAAPQTPPARFILVLALASATALRQAPASAIL